MTSKHYNWHKRWQLDVEAATASHESGFAVRFARADTVTEMPEIGGKCWTEDGREWMVLHVGGDVALKEWLQAQAKLGLRDVDSINRRIARLMREAGELWTHKKTKEH